MSDPTAERLASGYVRSPELLDNMNLDPDREAQFFHPPGNCQLDVGQAAVELGIEIGEYKGVVRRPRTRVEVYYLQRLRFESNRAKPWTGIC